MTTIAPLRSVPAYTPTMLTTYQLCPAKYRGRYVDREPGDGAMTPALARGQAAHAVLRQAFDTFSRSRAFPLDLAGSVERSLPRDAYNTEAGWRTDVETVLEWVRWPLADFDGSADVVGVERTYPYTFPGNDACPPFRLRATVDLVLRHPGGIIEHIDWKAGKASHADPIQTVVSRIVVGQEYRTRTEVRSTTGFISCGTKRSDILTREQVGAVWSDIKTLVTAIDADQDWTAVSNPLCPWCPRYGNGCVLYPTYEEGDTMTDWLEGVA